MQVARGALLVVAPAWMALAFACGGGGGETIRPGDETPNSAAAAQRDLTIAAMDQAQSYSVEMDVGEGEPIVIEFVKPNSYRTKVIAIDNQTGERTLGEQLYVGDTIYARKCEPDGANCGDWDTTERGDIIVGAASPSYFPQWPIVALEMADKVSLSGGALRGAVNHIRAVYQNSRRLVEANGGTYTDDVNEEEPDLSFYDEHPATLDVAIDSQTDLIERVAITIIAENEDADVGEQVVEPRTFVFLYTNYNDVTIEAPQ